MRRAVLFLIAVVTAITLLAATPAPAPAHWDGDRAALTERADELMDWIVKVAGQDVRPDLPAIIFATNEDINRSVRGSDYAGQTNTIAIYLPAYHVVVLPDTFELGVHDDILVHELFHHAQTWWGFEYACQVERERHAYLADRLFSLLTGIGEPVSEMAIKLMNCDQQTR